MDAPIPAVIVEFSKGFPVEASITVPLILPSKNGNGCAKTSPELNVMKTKTLIKATKNQKRLIFFASNQLLVRLRIKFFLTSIKRKHDQDAALEVVVVIVTSIFTPFVNTKTKTL
jgi:hypothetical protein